MNTSEHEHLSTDRVRRHTAPHVNERIDLLTRASVETEKQRGPDAIQLGFLLLHSAVGWCPPASLFRRLGFRTQREIEVERAALLSELTA